MQLNDLQELVSRLKENNDMQVETTTLGRFLGTNGTQVAMVLGKEILTRPVVISTREDHTQVLDLKSGFVISLSSLDEVLPKLISTFNNIPQQKPKKVASVERTKEIYEEAVKKEIHTSSLSRELCEFKVIMYKSGSIEDRVALVEKTIKLLENHKIACDNGEGEKIQKAQMKLNRLVEYARCKKLAPGQIPSVYELAIWKWVN